MADEERRLRFLRNWYAAYGAAGQDGQTVDSVSGRLLTFNTKYALPLVSLKLNIEAVQSGSGDPSPSNIRPITGFGGASIYHSGADTSDYTTYSVTWTDAGTVYSGILDINLGILTVDTAYKNLNGSESWTKSTNTACDIFMLQIPNANMSLFPCLSDKFRCSNNTAINSIGWIWRGTSNTQLRLGFAEYNTTTLAAFKTWLGNNNTQVVYPLATPLVYNLTPLQITTLIGTNNIWSNAGTLEAEYVR